MGAPLSNATRRILLVLSCVLVFIGNAGGPLMMRLYFVKGGSRLWLSCFLQTCGCPIILIPLLVSYFQRRKTDGPSAKMVFMQFPTFIAATTIGAFFGGGNYLVSFGVARLPVSTATLILSTQLVFTALSVFVLVKQKFTSYSINAIVLLTVGAAALALHSSSDRPEGESKKDYTLGFIMMFVAAAFNGLMFPLIELMYMKAGQALTYSLVMEIQIVLSIAASVVAIIGMSANNDFKVIPREAREFGLGEAKYYVVLVSNAIIWQMFILGAVGIIFCYSALLNGVIVAVLLPISQVLAVVSFHDKFTPEKGLSLALCLWGFVSHFYGEYKQSKKKNQIRIQESATNTPNIAPAIEMEP